MNGENRAVDLDGGRKFPFPWPSRILGPTPGLKEMNLVCWGVFAALLVTRFCYPLWIQFRTGVGSFHIRPADFIYFYGIGRIANEYPLARLYDYNLQLKTFNEIYALHDGAYGPSPYPPFVALFFGPFARVPFVPAFFLWASVSLALYLAGIAATVKGIFPGERLKVSLIFCFASGILSLSLQHTGQWTDRHCGGVLGWACDCAGTPLKAVFERAGALYSGL
jgi:hypothetical protein